MAVFGDIRVFNRSLWFLERIVATGSLVLKRLGGDRAGEMAAQRLLASPHASVEAILDTVSERTGIACVGREIVCAQDTSEINFKGKLSAPEGLGPGGDGRTAAFFVHPLVAIDVASGSVLGLAGAALWTRVEARVDPALKRGPLEKESHRWLLGAERAGAVLSQASRLTMVADRESDIYHLFANRPAHVELVVRAAQNRAIEDGGLLFDALSREAAVETRKVRIAARGPGDRERDASVELRARRVVLKRPSGLSAEDAPASLEVTLVEVRECNPPAGKTPVLWRLLSSADRSAGEIVKLYRLRWRIEEVFRALKSGLGLPETQVNSVRRLLLLAAFGLAAATRIIQLVDARDGSHQSIETVIDPGFKPALAAISRKLEGKTERQKNPHPPTSLAYLSWICARLGGWNCYYKPPGPKTMATGWKTLAQQLAGYLIAIETKNV